MLFGDTWRVRCLIGCHHPPLGRCAPVGGRDDGCGEDPDAEEQDYGSTPTSSSASDSDGSGGGGGYRRYGYGDDSSDDYDCISD